jgi:hypothetical protein
MRFFIILLTVFLSHDASAQIELEHSYPNAGYAGSNVANQQLYVVNLESAGAKYLYANKAGKKLRFYNLDHTLWKVIDYSAAIDLNPDYNLQVILYVSQHLFDLDDEVEFLYTDNSSGSVQEFVTQVVNEDGSIIFTAENQVPRMTATVPQDQLPIRNTPEGAKLILSDDGSGNGEAHVYGLPGSLAVSVEEDVFMQFTQSSLKTFPNPTTQEVKVEYHVPFGMQGALRFTDELGRTVQTVPLPSHEGSYTLDASTLGTGVYLCTLLSGAEVLATQKLSVIRNE